MLFIQARVGLKPFARHKTCTDKCDPQPQERKREEESQSPFSNRWPGVVTKDKDPQETCCCPCNGSRSDQREKCTGDKKEQAIEVSLFH